MIDEYDKAQRLRKRFWGAAVLIALAVIVLPMILDGAGSESQIRAVEQLREEPPPLDLPVPELARASRESEPVSQGELAPPPVVETPDEPEDPLTIWVVQAGAFDNNDNAVQLRDQLRSAGFASFVQNRDSNSEPFLVLVGPMIKQQSATKARDEVARLLQNDPVVATYQ